jgi:hypothetical protein
MMKEIALNRAKIRLKMRKMGLKRSPAAEKTWRLMRRLRSLRKKGK